MNVCLILSGGASARFGGERPKQYCALGGREVIAYSIEAMRDYAVVVVCAGAEEAGRLRGQYGVGTALGGDTRNESLRNGLEYIKRQYPDCAKVFVNEAARPFVTAGLIDEYFQKLDEYDAVITARHITDSLGKYGEHTADRAAYYLVQAPEAFRFGLLYAHFDAASALTATAQQLPPGSAVYRHFAFRHNLKITYPEDLVLAEALMRYLNESGGLDKRGADC